MKKCTAAVLKDTRCGAFILHIKNEDTEDE